MTAINNKQIKQMIKDITTHRFIYERKIEKSNEVIQCLSLIEEDENGNRKIDPQTGEPMTDEKRQAMYDLWIGKARDLIAKHNAGVARARESSEEPESEE